MMSNSGLGANVLSEPTRVVVGTLLYSVKFDRLGDALVERRARALLEEPLRELTVEEEYRAIVEALDSTAALSKTIEISDWVQTAPGEEEFRDFLRRLRDRRDAMRPWAAPLHHALNEYRWPGQYMGARVVGRIKVHWVQAQNAVNYVFSGVQDGDGERNVLVLKLRSGDEVALVAPWWSGSDDVAVLSRDPTRPPREVRAALVDGTRFTPEQVEPVPADEVTHPRETGAP